MAGPFSAPGGSDLLVRIEWEARRHTLLAERLDRKTDSGAVVYRFDIRLQGEAETVFFDL